MRYIKRLEEPEILSRKKEEWTKKLIESGKKRPDSSKYAHPQIREKLEIMSYNKCSYCESLLKCIPSEVDHHIEVSVDIYLSYEWVNLALCCKNCNKKINHNEIPIDNALNPFKDKDFKIQENITFDKELIRTKNLSELGAETVRKYRLDSKTLDHLRMKSLQIFYEVIIRIQRNLIINERSELLEDEKEKLLYFTHMSNPYSLMFIELFKKNNLIEDLLKI